MNEECYPRLYDIANKKFKMATDGKRMSQNSTSNNDIERINKHIRARMLEIFTHIKDSADTSKVNNSGHRLPCHSISKLCNYVNFALSGLKRSLPNYNNFLAWDAQNNCLSPYFIELLDRSGLADLSKDDAFVSLFRIMYASECQFNSSDGALRVRRSTSASRSELRFLDSFPGRINALLVADGVYHNFLQCVTGTSFNHSEYLCILEAVRAKVFDVFSKHEWSFDTLHAQTQFPYNIEARLKLLEILGGIRSAHDSLKDSQVLKEVTQDYFRQKLAQTVPQRWIVLKEIRKLNSCDADADVTVASSIITQIFATGNADLIPILNKLLGPQSTNGFYISLKVEWEKLGQQLPNHHQPSDSASSPQWSYNGSADEVKSRAKYIHRKFNREVNAGIITIKTEEMRDGQHQVTACLNVPSHILNRYK